MGRLLRSRSQPLNKPPPLLKRLLQGMQAMGFANLLGFYPKRFIRLKKARHGGSGTAQSLGSSRRSALVLVQKINGPKSE